MIGAYRRLEPRHVERLREIVGPDRVHIDDETLSIYARDETEDFRFPPEAVVKPAGADEIADILRLADAELLPVTPRAAGTGLSGGALPIFGGIVLSVERMNRIVEVDERNFMAVVEAGVVTGALHAEVERRGLFYPPDPASRGSCTIGGNIAENAGGPRAVKYGVTEDWVRGLDAVLPSGEHLEAGGKRLKDVTGYNLVKMLIGSEGTLAVVTRATLKLIPKPRFRRTLLCPFPTLEAAARTVPAVFQARVIPCAIEFMERAAVLAADRLLGTGVAAAAPAAEAFLLIEVDGNDEAAVARELEAVGETCLAEAGDVFVAEGETKQEELWRMRRAVGEAVKKLSAYREEDTVVPRANVPALVRGVREVVARHKVRAICYGHAGDGNIHVNVLRGDMDPAEWRRVSPVVSREIFGVAIGLGGTISGEHGIGYSQKQNLPLALSAASIALHRRIKEAFDPHYILNPGKIFDRA